ncbi:EF-hand domain-containing protein [Gramella sp. AN32]|uniref:EF-hand domain-containing protein n=1 Tax=Christiangramia antarctica TaxID=2058158 RepID=A0ABW5X9B4_9FLAO|nr:EF-hand domain-containing protein [Gramella sp. AN32]MCM4155505.1 hypothetical protein [Gramella sp. AN32]
MKTKNLKLAALVGIIAVFSSCKSSAQNSSDRKEPPSVEEIFKKLDENEDGKLSKEEVKGPLEKDFSKIDTNEDGFISQEELEKAPKPKRPEGRSRGK